MLVTEPHDIIHRDATIIVGVHRADQFVDATARDLGRAVDQVVVLLGDG